MISIKDEDGFAKMAAAGKVVAAVLDALRLAAEPGTSMVELDQLASGIIRDHGCTPSFLGYHGFPAHVCTSPNSVIVHGIPDGYTLVEGDILSVDAGAIYDGYHADAAVTFAVGEVADDVRRLIRVTESALWAGIDQVRPGARIGDISHAVQKVVEEAGFSVVREYVGHGIGHAMHEDPQIPNFGDAGRGMKLKRGMAVCIEPMVNVGDWRTRVLDDGWTVVTADGSLSAHFEHTVAITEDGPVVLTA